MALGSQESEAGAGKEIGAYDFAYYGQADFVFEIQWNLDVVALDVAVGSEHGVLIGAVGGSGLETVIVQAVNIHYREVESYADQGHVHFHHQTAGESCAVIGIEDVGIESHGIHFRAYTWAKAEDFACRGAEAACCEHDSCKKKSDCFHNIIYLVFSLDLCKSNIFICIRQKLPC